MPEPLKAPFPSAMALALRFVEAGTLVIELVTGAGNMQHSYANGRPKPWSKSPEESLASGTGKGTWRGKPRVTEVQKAEVRRLRLLGHSYREIGEAIGLSISHVQRISKGVI